MIRIALLAAVLARCAAPQGQRVAQRRECPPLPELRSGAKPAEHVLHTQTIVRMYAACAESAP